ncbi:dynamin family protein [Cryptosporangium aurantiacum]|uniref:Dynamin family protein n=1 Tax=Cryptosporangium aurantiacum TaxID=134849 RepID=A0A1M7TXE3_9ACTN|nr:dynamin family protein [Cryptosporangium aurantiacum]SHN75380.1 Dynamin family protein [Cryptosporangium aurantiacum]
MTAPSLLDTLADAGGPDGDAAAIAVLPAAVRAAYQAAEHTGHRLRLGVVPECTLVLLGPADAGKTAFTSALLADGVRGLVGLAERPGPGTPVPVEYAYGGEPELWLGLGGTVSDPAEWVRAPLDTPDLDRLPELRRVRAAVPSAVLRDWGVRIVDCPGLDDVADLTGPALDEARKPGVGVLYLVPRRGITELDAQALEALRHVPLVLIENRRDAEIAGAAASVDELAVPGLDVGLAVPLAVRRLARPGPERDTVLRCVALLRTRTAPDRWTAALGAAAVRSREALGAEFARRRTMALMARHPDWLGSLHLLADLLGIERDGPGVIELDDRLTRITRLAQAARPAEALRALVDRDVRAAVDRYNAEAVRDAGVRPPRDDAPPAAFGRSYAELRDELVTLLDTTLADDVLGATASERDALAEIRSGVLDDQLEVAVLGQSSSGKSSLINALLGVRTGTALLPTAPRPTTATVNRVEYAPRPGLNVTWLPEVELRLLSPGAEPNQVRVHVENIRALGRWLRDRSVRARDCVFHPLAPQPDRLDGQAAFWRLWKILDLAGDPALYAYLAPSPDRPRLTDLSVPAEVTVRRFATVPDQWPGSLASERAFAELTRDPALALRVDTLRVGVPHPLLRHVTIVDTPGTDAPVPHHRLTAHRAVRDQRHSAVVYCFDGAKPASREDSANLAFLRERLGTGDPARYFFVITRRGVVERDADRVRETVENALAASGDEPPRTYFTEVLRELNDDFRALADDLGRYVLITRRTLLRSWIERTQRVLEDVHGRHLRRLQRLADSEDGRITRLRTLRQEFAQLDTLRGDLRAADWGEPWLRGRTTNLLDGGTAQIDHIVRGLTNRRTFAAGRPRLTTGIEELNHAVRDRLAADCAALAAELAARLPGRGVGPLELTWDEEPFGAAGVDAAMAATEWRTGWQRFRVLFDPRRRRSDAEANRALVTAAWTLSRDRGTQAVADAVDLYAGHLHAELARLADGLATEIAAAEQDPHPDDRVRATEGRDRASTRLARLDALSRHPDLSGGDR